MTRPLVVDANILIRAVLGTRAHTLIERYADRVTFFTTHEAVQDAERYIPPVLERRDGSDRTVAAALEKLRALKAFFHVVSAEPLIRLEGVARRRLANRDEEDWPFIALALMLDGPIWTEDTDFFGAGVAVWTTDRIEIFLANGEESITGQSGKESV